MVRTTGRRMNLDDNPPPGLMGWLYRPETMRCDGDGCGSEVRRDDLLFEYRGAVARKLCPRCVNGLRATG